MSDPTTPVPPRKRRGCLFYGCLTFAVLCLFVCILAVAGVCWIKHRINLVTDAAPMQLPKVEMTDADLQALQRRVKTFGDALNQDKTPPPLVLSEKEVNALLARTPNTTEWANKVYVSLSENHVRGRVSIPLTFMGWLGRGRYLNGEADFKVSLQNGVLVVTADAIEVKGKALSERFMEILRNENLAKELYQHPKDAEAIRKLESIQVEDGRAIIKARSAQ